MSDGSVASGFGNSSSCVIACLTATTDAGSQVQAPVYDASSAVTDATKELWVIFEESCYRQPRSEGAC